MTNHTFNDSQGAVKPVAWMNREHIGAYMAGTPRGIAWASPEQTDFYDVALYAAQPPAAPVETTCCKGLAPTWECRCEIERKAAGHPPYQRLSAATEDETFRAIHDALKVANIEYSAFSTNGVVVFGHKNSVQKAAEAFHSHSQIDYFRTQIRHWREECGKLHAKLDGLSVSPQEAWQPIKTAPTGVPVLAMEDFHREDEDGKKYPKDYQVVTKINGKWSSFGLYLESFEPTHWQQLPSSPLSRPQSQSEG